MLSPNQVLSQQLHPCFLNILLDSAQLEHTMNVALSNYIVLYYAVHGTNNTDEHDFCIMFSDGSKTSKMKKSYKSAFTSCKIPLITALWILFGSILGFGSNFPEGSFHETNIFFPEELGTTVGSLPSSCQGSWKDEQNYKYTILWKTQGHYCCDRRLQMFQDDKHSFHGFEILMLLPELTSTRSGF